MNLRNILIKEDLVKFQYCKEKKNVFLQTERLHYI